MAKKKVFLKECYIQNTNHYSALDVWNRLKIGKSLNLKYIDDKVMLYINVAKSIKNIGFLSDEDAIDIKQYVKSGWGNMLYEARLSYIDESNSDESKRMKAVIYIMHHNNADGQL